MSDSLGGASDPAAAPSTAGALLRQARQARGLHIAALAASIKVTPHKLELLETDRFDELPGATFTRALAQTVCRSLKIDAAPVMALLPQAPGLGLEQMSRGLNQPFRERPGRRDPDELQFLKNPVLIGAIALGALALAVYLLPSGWLASRFDRPVDKSGDSRSVPATEAAQPGGGGRAAFVRRRPGRGGETRGDGGDGVSWRTLTRCRVGAGRSCICRTRRTRRGRAATACQRQVLGQCARSPRRVAAVAHGAARRDRRPRRGDAASRQNRQCGSHPAHL